MKDASKKCNLVEEYLLSCIVNNYICPKRIETWHFLFILACIHPLVGKKLGKTNFWILNQRQPQDFGQKHQTPMVDIIIKWDDSYLRP